MENKIKKKIKPSSLPILLVPFLIISLLFSLRFPFNGIVTQQRYTTSTTTPHGHNHGHNAAICSNMANGTICCDRTSYHSDICFMRGDVRTDPSSSSVLLFSTNMKSSSSSVEEERIRPYTRKWESVVMARIPQLRLKIVNPKTSPSLRNCDVRHNVTALFFSLGSYTGNVFHAFNNDLIPLYITSQHLNRQVVFVVLEYRQWWHAKYRDLLSQLSDYPVINFSNDTRTHCFPDATVGLRFHDALTIDPSRMQGNKSMADFQNMLDNAYSHHSVNVVVVRRDKPKLVVMSRSSTRAIENEGEVVGTAEEVGFEVEVLRPTDAMSMSWIYNVVSSCDVMVGVHGAALTHFLFMRAGSLFVQIVPVGVDELAELCYGEPAARMRVKYEKYSVLPTESSLRRRYGGGDVRVRDPRRARRRGWVFTKEVYLEGQNVTLDVGRLRQRLVSAFQQAILRRSHQL